MIIGYGRVSTSGQDLELQRDLLTQAGCVRIFEEKISGSKLERPELMRLLDHLREGDLVIVSRLDRLARSTIDLLTIADKLNQIGAGLQSLAEPWLNTTSPAGQMIMTIFAGIASFERSLIVDRTRAGREAARKKGIKFGPKPRLSKDQIEHAESLVAAGKSVSQIAGLLGVHRATVYRALNRSQSI
ncbi:recombinase family protein [Pseudomonas asiatica]|uniref:Recombinase family protein n=1 Tax=Pseudomonas asiatica TaxID=2219225 RepID=A0A9X4D316_9PSED|nr:recombinase family protein [Pseudomonas asiatica]MDD2108326.1 recombinase family protein [Pseudomonas asiatica]